MKQKVLNVVKERLDEVFPEGGYEIVVIAITGSQAYGMNTKDSDLDIQGLFIPPIDYLVGLHKVEQVVLPKNKELNMEGTMYALDKWYRLMVDQNPNVMELLWHEENMYLHRNSEYWPLLHDNRFKLLSKKLKYTYAGYAFAQMQRLSKLDEKINQNTKRLENFNKFGYDTKAASHVFRLLGSALDALVMEEIKVMRPERNFLMAIREGQYTYEDLVRMSQEKMNLVEQAFITSKLPNRVNFTFANELLRDIHAKFIKLKYFK